MTLREPGTVLDGKYEIVRRLGSGGMGEVHLVRHLHLQELRVVKILRQDLASDPSAQARFLREARLATQIKHPNVAILYDFARLPDGSFYMVWEYIEGQDVGDRIRKNGPFPVPAAIQLGIQALRGLEAIHQTGVIHRDLSPDNLMITEDRRGQYRMKIIDLGLAKNLGAAPEPNPNLEITQVGMFMGKLQYCSPEQAGTISGETLDRRSDLYSFALVLYEMLVGVPPFDSENPHGFVFKRLSEDPLPLVGRNPMIEVPAGLDQVVRRALERDREKRYPDAVSFILALDKVGKELDKIETQEIVITPALAAPTASVAPRPAPVTPRQRSSSELSADERRELLAQIERAGRKTQESTQVLSQAEVALAAGKIDEAKAVLRQVEAVHPRAQGLEQLKARVRQAEELVQQGQRTAETEQVLAGYLEKRQLALSRLALETLLELQPVHPRRAEYEAAIAHLARDLEQEKRAEKALAAGREAVAAGDLRAARRELEGLVRIDPSGPRAAVLRAAIETAERGQKQGAELDEHRRRLEEYIASRRVAEAEVELQQLSAMEVTKVTLDSYRNRLDEVRSQSLERERVAEFERRYRILLDHQDWFGAREVATEFEATLPGHSRAAAMFGEINRLESVYRHQESIEQGVRQIETFIAQGDAGKAELALKILLQMDPENRHRRRLERQIKGLKKG